MSVSKCFRFCRHICLKVVVDKSLRDHLVAQVFFFVCNQVISLPFSVALLFVLFTRFFFC